MLPTGEGYADSGVGTHLGACPSVSLSNTVRCCGTECSRLERDMLTVVWAPTLAAVSVVLGRASDTEVVSGALKCLMRAAFVAAYHRMDEVGLGSPQYVFEHRRLEGFAFSGSFESSWTHGRINCRSDTHHVIASHSVSYHSIAGIVCKCWSGTISDQCVHPGCRYHPLNIPWQYRSISRSG